MNRRLFVDASFWIALRDPFEAKYDQARRLMERLIENREHFVITLLVFAETHAYFAKAQFRSKQILDDFEQNPVFDCEEVSLRDQQEAIRLLRQYRDKSFSFCDAVSFVVMRRLGLRRVASLDDHFRQFGEFDVIP
jgi:predicted nucleic acid-binding protein